MKTSDDKKHSHLTFDNISNIHEFHNYGYSLLLKVIAYTSIARLNYKIASYLGSLVTSSCFLGVSYSYIFNFLGIFNEKISWIKPRQMLWFVY